MTPTKPVKPKVGMGASICFLSDRHAATIVKITRTQVHVQEDDATRTDKNGMSENQTYTYKRNKNAAVEIFRLNKRGVYKSKNGTRLLIGVRSQYWDPSF